MDTRSKRIPPLFKILDRYLGIPVVFILGLFKKNKPLPKQLRHIALLKTAGIGDTVLLSGIIDGLFTQYPSVKITLFVSQSNAEFTQIITLRHPSLEVTILPIKNPIKAINILRKHHFDCWFDFGPWPRLNAIFSYFAHARFTIGFNTPAQYRHYGYDLAIPHKTTQHEIENYRALFANTPLAITSVRPNLQNIFSKETLSDKTIVLHMFSGGAKRQLKSIPTSTWITLSNRLIAEGFKLIFTGDMQDKLAAESVQSQCQIPNEITIMAGQKTLSALAPVLLSASLVITVDTGLMHFASALQCKVLSLHGPTDPARWGGLGKHTHSLYANLFCAPCLQLGFESNCTDNQCLKHFSVDTLLKKIYLLTR